MIVVIGQSSNDVVFDILRQSNAACKACLGPDAAVPAVDQVMPAEIRIINKYYDTRVPVASLSDEYAPHMRMVLDAHALIHTIPACMFESADTMNAYLSSIPAGVSNSSNSAKLMVVPDWTGDVYEACEVGPVRLWNAVQVVPWPSAAGTARAGDHPEVTAATGPDIAGAAAASELADAMGDGVDAALDDLFSGPEMLELLEQMKAVRESSLQAGQAGESEAQRAERHAAAQQVALQFARALGLEEDGSSDAEDEGAGSGAGQVDYA